MVTLRVRSGETWELPEREFREWVGGIETTCRACHRGKLDLYVSVQRREITLICEQCCVYHNMSNGKTYPRIIDLLECFRSLVGGDLGRYV